MTLLELFLVQANVWYLAFCVVMPSLGKTAEGTGQFVSVPVGGLLLAWAFFGFVSARELDAEAAFNARCFYVGTGLVTLLSIAIVWRPWKRKANEP